MMVVIVISTVIVVSVIVIFFITILFGSSYGRQYANGGAQGPWKPLKKLRSFWSVVYILMGLATWRVVRRGGIAEQSVPLLAYGFLLLAKGLTWPPLFFGGHSLPRAVAESAGRNKAHNAAFPICVRRSGCLCYVHTTVCVDIPDLLEFWMRGGLDCPFSFVND
jgi:tryptophan-rich sensory protein